MKWLKNSYKKLVAAILGSVLTGILINSGMEPETVKRIVDALAVLLIGMGAIDAGKTNALIVKGLAAPPWYLFAIYAALAAIVPIVGPVIGLSPDLCAAIREILLALSGGQALSSWKESKFKLTGTP